MNLEHEFAVPVPVDEAWHVLLDVQRVAPCMPGATLLTIDGDDFTGTVKVKVGPIQVTYKGKATFVEREAATHRAVIEAAGKEARGPGTASADEAPTPPAAPRPAPVQAEPIDLMQVAGGSVAKRLIPALAAVAAVCAVLVLLRRHRRRS